jgi:hypothetical protein
MTTPDALPLRIFHPITPSLEAALPILLSCEDLVVSIHELNSDCFDLAEKSLPAICLFSVTDETIRGRLKKLMETRLEERTKDGLSRIDSKLRVVLVSEERRGLVLDSWQALGAHEVMLAPILSRSLLNKVLRHVTKGRQAAAAELEYAKKLDPLTRTKEKGPKCQVNADTLIGAPAQKTPKEEPKLRIHGIALGPNTFLFPHNEDADGNGPHKTVTSVVVLDKRMAPATGQWVLTREEDSDGEGCWDWVVSHAENLNRPPESLKRGSKFRYYGYRPVYDEKKKAWVFSGKAPKLYSRPEQSDEAQSGTKLESAKQDKEKDVETPENTAFVTTKKNGVIFFKKQLKMADIKVWHFDKKSWDQGPGKAFTKDQNSRDWNRGDLSKDDAQDWNQNKAGGTGTAMGSVADGSAKGKSSWDASHPDAGPRKKKSATPDKDSQTKAEEDIDEALLKALKSAAYGKASS